MCMFTIKHKLVCSILLFLSGSAQALTCADPNESLEAVVQNADHIFLGRFKKKLGSVSNWPENSNRRANVILIKSLKGREFKDVEIYYFEPPRKPFFSESGFLSYSCSQKKFTGFSTRELRGREYLIFTKEINGKLYTSYELGTRWAQPKNAVGEVEKILANEAAKRKSTEK